MEAILVSTLAVAIGEIGDKTQLLALILATRFQKPLPIILGILVATLANHFFAGFVGTWISQHLSKEVLRYVVGISFAAIALWVLKPDKMDEEHKTHDNYGAFIATVITFFLAEMGDKTQIVTVAMAMKYQNLLAVVTGTTAGMLIADVPAVFIGSAAAEKIPLRLVRVVAAVIFAILALLVFFAGGNLI